MTEELKDFIDNWQIDVKNKSAEHKSGLKVAYDSTNEDGSIRVATSGMSTFLKNTYAELQDDGAVDKRYKELTEEFVQIYKAQMTSSDRQIMPVMQNSSREL